MFPITFNNRRFQLTRIGQFDSIDGQAQESAYFLIGQIIGCSIDDYDFRERLSDYEGAIDMDLDKRFSGW